MILAELGEKLGRELRDGALVVSNAHRIPSQGGRLRLIRTVPVETAEWDLDGSSSLFLYRVYRTEVPSPALLDTSTAEGKMRRQRGGPYPQATGTSKRR